MPKFNRVYRPYYEWEETAAGLWRRPTGDERSAWILRCAEFMAVTVNFRNGMLRAIEEWPNSCEVNFTSYASNRQAWLGHAACCISIGCPEEPTRAAWWTLTERQRVDADKAAAEVILIWEERYAKTQNRD
jgi:hypothetical protein